MSIQVVCSWCGKHLGTKPGDAAMPVSHSICPECARKLSAEADEPHNTQSKEEDR